MKAIRGQLRDLIIDGTLAPGSVLRQQQLAERLGVSRTPLREALLALEQEGLVESSSGGKSRVTELSDEDARESMEARELVDGLAARLLAQRNLPAPLQLELEQYVSSMERIVAAGREDGYESTDIQFHLAMLTGLRSRWLEPFTTLVRISSRAALMRLQVHPIYRGRSIGEHRAILRAILAHRPDEAEEAARLHVRGALRHWEGVDDD
jgi:GntR family transcriptional regulator of vanillate catabolism